MLNGSQTFVLDKEALESCESTCMLFVFSQRAPTHCPTVVKHTSVVKHCGVFAICSLECAASLFIYLSTVCCRYASRQSMAPCGCHVTVALRGQCPTIWVMILAIRHSHPFHALIGQLYGDERGARLSQSCAPFLSTLFFIVKTILNNMWLVTRSSSYMSLPDH